MSKPDQILHIEPATELKFVGIYFRWFSFKWRKIKYSRFLLTSTLCRCLPYRESAYDNV